MSCEVNELMFSQNTIFTWKKDLRTNYGYSDLLCGNHFNENELSELVTSSKILIVTNDEVRGFKWILENVYPHYHELDSFQIPKDFWYI